MAKVPVKDSKQEIALRKYLFSKGYRFRKNDRRLPGKPDIVLPKYKTVVFVHGCFWHGHAQCRYAKIPSSNVVFWQTKLNANVIRDAKNERLLRKAGWHIFIVWQCKMNTPVKTKKIFNRLDNFLKATSAKRKRY